MEHVGIIINSMAPVAYGSWNASLHSGELANAWVHYDASDKLLNVFVTYD